MGRSAFCGDISQFYPTISLSQDHWRFQRILLREDLSPSGDLIEAVLVKLAFGVQCVSAQSEEAVKKIANELWDTDAAVASLLLKLRYVDDIAKSTNNFKDSKLLTSRTSEILKNRLNMEIKGWCFAGENPPLEVSKDGVSVDIGGHVWFTKSDLFALNIPPICLTRKQRGKLPQGAYGFDPKTMSLEDFVPSSLNRRMCTSSVAKVWDPLGKVAPITLRLKDDLRKLIAESPDWDTPVSKLSRKLWIQNFGLIEEIRGLVYPRCARPDDALRDTCRILILVDAAEWGMILTAYIGWERENGAYSCSHLFGKGLLGPETLTLPQKELHILNVGADISELFSVSLSDWVEDIVVAGDSEIALCWVLYESVKLNMYNRVRVLNIRSKLKLENLYHVKGPENPADIGTRVEGIRAEDVYPGSEYLTGKFWMTLSKEDASKAGFIKPIQEIKLEHEQKKVLKKGIVFDGFEPEDSSVVAVLMTARVDQDKVAVREAEADYLFSPLVRNFLSLVDIIALVLKAAKLFGKEKISIKPVLSKVPPARFYSERVFKSPPTSVITDLDRNLALQHIFRKESQILKKFMPTKQLDKISIEKEGILYSKTRVLEGQTVKIVGGLQVDTSLAGLFNLNFEVPLVDQHSPLAYPLSLHFHSLFNHRGAESCYRLSLNYVPCS